jgi:hypothetical protein
MPEPPRRGSAVSSPPLSRLVHLSSAPEARRSCRSSLAAVLPPRGRSGPKPSSNDDRGPRPLVRTSAADKLVGCARGAPVLPRLSAAAVLHRAADSQPKLAQTSTVAAARFIVKK